MEKYYTDERHTQILIYLLKQHGIRKVVASPGTTNLTFIGSIQNDPYFELYSSVDERSAAYMACGMAAESDEPVILSCTGATASRNYPSGLTEAFYRKLPILAITSTQHPGRIGHNMPQVIDRTTQFNDICVMSKLITAIHNEEDAWNVVVSINEALLELRHNGGGPVHLNLQTTYSKNYDVKELPPIRVIRRFGYNDNLPQLPKGRIAIFVGAHAKWTNDLRDAVSTFCEKYDAPVFCDQTSNYKGQNAIYPSLVCSQAEYMSDCRNLDLLIHIGDVSGATISMNSKCSYDVWRVNPDGKVRDTFNKLKCVFEMEEKDFFLHYLDDKYTGHTTGYYDMWKEECETIKRKIPELPFSNVWIAQNSVKYIPQNATVYFAILNTLRSWNFCEAPANITGYSNTGGFGIDGGVSTLLGSSLVNKDKLYFCIVGDLGFFYDMNAIGNRHVGNNIRILVVNNGRGTEFTNYNHPGAAFGADAKPYIAAAGHYGNKSPDLLRHYSEDLGFIYLSANTKEEYMSNLEIFMNPEIGNAPILFEVFTDGEDESDAVKIMHHLETSTAGTTKAVLKNMLGEKNIATIKKIIKR